jgi:peroxiredoxin
MIRQLLTTFALLIIYTYNSHCNNLDTCRLSVYSTTLANKYVKLGYYYGSKTFLKDTLFINKTGTVDYKNLLHAGIYFLYLPDSSVFDFMIDGGIQHNVYVDRKKNTFLCSIKGDPASEAFDIYQQELGILSGTLDSLHSANKLSPGDTTGYMLKKQIIDVNEKIRYLKYRYSLLYPGSLLSKYLKAMIPLDIKELAKGENNFGGDSINLVSRLKYYQDHYLDNIDMNDERLLFTPVLSEKINFYLEKIISQKSDIIVSETERLVNLSGNSDIKKFIIENQYSKYSSKKNKPYGEYIYASLIERFYLKGKTPWLSTDQLQILTEEYNRIQPTLLYKQAPEIKLPGLAYDSISLYATKANYTLLFFWEPGCAYCTKIIQELNKVTSKYNYLPVKVFAVCLDTNREQWVEFVDSKMPKTWINTIETRDSKTALKYNIARTPAMYLLDPDKKIIDKNFTIPELDANLLKVAIRGKN